MAQPSFARVKEVFEQWSMYDTVVRADYMCHAEIDTALTRWGAEQTKPLRIIDLGCGDSGMATAAWSAANVASYRGVDVSEASIERAREHVQIWQGRAEVSAGNLADFVHSLATGSANVVLASYTIHHFSTEAKVSLIVDIHRVLARDGSFIWIDAVRNDGESRDAYIARLIHEMERDWMALTNDQRAAACTHVRESDFPEPRGWMLKQVAAAGFKTSETILQNKFFDGWVFTKD